MSNENYLKKIKKTPYLLAYFSYPECQVCKVLKPKVQELLTRYPDFEFAYIDINQNPIFKGQYMVFAVPTIILFNQGRELQRFSRNFSLLELESYLEQTISK
jgi:thioredoxin-like negative regulator of GroEL